MTLALITNDDGIDSPGLDVLAQTAIDAGLEVLVVAPLNDCSGMSAAVTGDESDVRTVFTAEDSSRIPGVAGNALNGTPGLISLVAMHGAFGRTPDVVLSGINRGGNFGSSVIHSATVGAALTGAMSGARSLAVSLTVGNADETPLWQAAVPYIRHVLPTVLANKPGTTLSLNVPNATHVWGLRPAHLASFSIVQASVHGENENGELPEDTLVGDSEAEQRLESDSTSDAYLLEQGYATITQLVAVHEVAGSDLSNLGTDLTWDIGSDFDDTI